MSHKGNIQYSMAQEPGGAHKEKNNQIRISVTVGFELKSNQINSDITKNSSG